MKYYLFSLVVISFALFVCSCQHQEKPESALFRDFNLGATVQQMNVAQLQPKTGGNSVSTWFGEITERRRDFILVYLLDEQNTEGFDEATFLDNLRVQIAQKISDAGLRTNLSRSYKDCFDFTYSKDESKGSIDVIGAKVEGNKYKLWCVMRESAVTK